jgi:hypothetical protein
MLNPQAPGAVAADVASPQVSVVVTARNDNHGGDMLQRMQIFVHGLLEQCRRHGLRGELIIVEWNPPSDRPRLAEALSWPREDGPCTVRIIEVPPHAHRRYRYSDKLPLFQMIAKNVGIRRARGQFILSTNIDLLFSDPLVRFLASGQLQPDCMYRIDRFDVSAAVPVGALVDRQLEYCRSHVIRVNTRRGTFEKGRPKLLPLLAKGAAWTGKAWAQPSLVPEVLWAMVCRLFDKGLHTNSCGDFTLLSRERWHALHGYPEVEMYSLHLDSVFLNMAVHAGAREVVLRKGMRLYHIEHASGWSPAGSERLRQRMRELGVPMLDMDSYRVWIDAIKRGPTAPVANGEDWGLGSDDLRETHPLEMRHKAGIFHS